LLRIFNSKPLSDYIGVSPPSKKNKPLALSKKQNYTSFKYNQSKIRVWSLICKEKPIVLFERNCHASEKSEAIMYVHVQGDAGHPG
jgi:hypothetical protein